MKANFYSESNINDLVKKNKITISIGVVLSFLSIVGFILSIIFVNDSRYVLFVTLNSFSLFVFFSILYYLISNVIIPNRYIIKHIKDTLQKQEIQYNSVTLLIKDRKTIDKGIKALEVLCRSNDEEISLYVFDDSLSIKLQENKQYNIIAKGMFIVDSLELEND